MLGRLSLNPGHDFTRVVPQLFNRKLLSCAKLTSNMGDLEIEGRNSKPFFPLFPRPLFAIPL